MGNNRYQVTVTVEATPRGSADQQQYLQFAAAQCVCTWSWGLQPATALIDWVSLQTQASILPLSQLTIQIQDRVTNSVLHTFYGICKSVVPTVGSDGFSTYQEFVDSREFLQWDCVFCCFNKRESKILNGQWVRRYWHIFPNDFNAQLKTYTDAPLTAIQIMDALFSAPTCQSPWVRTYHPALGFPVYDFDCFSGKKLGTALVELSEALGCVFTLMGGRYSLVWTMKGVGTVPAFPANSDNRRLGTCLSGNPTRVRLMGGRDLYQMMNLALEPDWLPAWEEFYDLDSLATDLFDNEAIEAPIGDLPAGTFYSDIPDDAGGLQGRYLAAARARTITVGQYADLRDARSDDGDQFRDYRKFGGRSRLQMPAALYIQSVLFRAFRPPMSFSLRNTYGALMNVYAVELVDRSLVEVTHDPQTGEMSWERDVISSGNGYAIAQGYQVQHDGYKTLRPQYLRVDDWVSNQKTWQHLTFQTDDSGEGTKFIVFDAPVINSADLLTQCEDWMNYPVINAQPVIKAPTVQASLIFAAEPFGYVAGVGTRDEVQNVSGLNGEFVIESDGAVEELAFADGCTATQKATAIAASLLNGQFLYALGGYTVQGINGTQLSPVIDRVTVRWAENGATEEVDYTTERDRNVSIIGRICVLQVPPERDFDRREQLLQLLPGQRELIEESRQMQLDAVSLRQNPRMARTIVEAFTMAFGHDGMPFSAFIDPWDLEDYPGYSVDVGTPLYRDADSDYPLALSPFRWGDPNAELDPKNPEFVGVAAYHGDLPDGPVRVTAQGDQGVVLARVMGPLSPNDAVGLNQTPACYLEGAPEGGKLRLVVGTVLESVPDGVIQLARVRTSAMGSGGIRWQGEFDPDKDYEVGDMVEVTETPIEGDGNNYTGVWLCVLACQGEQPIYPYPETMYWTLIAMGIREINVADNIIGSKKMLNSCNDPYDANY